MHIFVERGKTIRQDSIKHRKVDTSESQSIIEIILENAAHSFLENLELPEFQISSCCRKIIESLRRDDVFNAATVNQSMKEWQNLRKLRVTGSRIYSLFTYSKDNWSEKAVNYFWPKCFQSKFTEYGKQQEPHALSAYKK